MRRVVRGAHLRVSMVLWLALAGCADETTDPDLIGEQPEPMSEAGAPRVDAGSGTARDASAASSGPDASNGVGLDAGRADVTSGRPIAAGLEVPTDEGAVRGRQIGKSRAFLGIPYAKPPVGALRWRAPEPAERRASTLDATEFGAVCAQSLPLVGFDASSSEDCLTLNVWTPDPAPARPLPVMVFIHGGAYQLGSGGDMYDGRNLSEAGQVVVVTLNYRLGALGFLAHPALSGESATGGSGNWGIRDQQRALAWVRANISAFAGDERNVTLFGESAGGNSTCMHLLSPRSKGLFDKVIVQSGLCVKPLLTQADADVLGKRLESELGCSEETDVLGCMRAVAARVVTQRTALDDSAAGGMIYTDVKTTYFPQPTVDGDVLTGQPETLFARGYFEKVPVLHGANTDEGALFHAGFPLGGTISTRREFQRLVRSLWGDHVDEIERLYAPPANPDWNEALSQVSGDAVFLCPSRRLAAYLERAGQPNYHYRFNGPLESLLSPSVSGRAIHSADIPYVFGNDFALGSIPDAKRPLIATMQSYWTRFAQKGDPNGDSTEGPAWRPYTAAGTDEHVLDVPVSVQALDKRTQCALWQRISGLP